MRCILFALVVALVCCGSVLSNNLLFGVTHSGKTSLINAACGLSLPVADLNQPFSTTRVISSHKCHDSGVIDTVGVFDYTAEYPLEVHEVLKVILDTISHTGLSSVLWVWSSKITVGNKQLEEEVFQTLRDLLPYVLPIAIVNNEFPGSSSGVPKLYSDKFHLPVLRASIADPGQVRDWIQSHTVTYRVELPPNYEDYLFQHNYKGLHEQILKLSLLSCDVVKKQLDVLQNKVNSMKEPPISDCHCDQNCQICEKRCRQKILGRCIGAYHHCWEDGGCHDRVRHCHESCNKAKNQAIQDFNTLKNKLIEEYKHLSESNSKLLNTCNENRNAKFQQQEL